MEDGKTGPADPPAGRHYVKVPVDNIGGIEVSQERIDFQVPGLRPYLSGHGLDGLLDVAIHRQGRQTRINSRNAGYYNIVSTLYNLQPFFQVLRYIKLLFRGRCKLK
jgi:hypothetical protein